MQPSVLFEDLHSGERSAAIPQAPSRSTDRAAAIRRSIITTKLNDVDPQAWLADVLGQIADIRRVGLPIAALELEATKSASGRLIRSRYAAVLGVGFHLIELSLGI